MNKGLRVVGFTFSNHGESTLNSEVSNAKLQTQRSLLSELLAVHAIEGEEEDYNGSGSEDTDDDDDDYEACEEEPAPVARQDTFGLQRSSPITIPCPEWLAVQRAKDAYRRLLNQRQAEQLYYQQQQMMQYQVQQQLLIQQQRRMQHLQQQQQQSSEVTHQTGQEHKVGVQACGQTSAVKVY